jgi:hypothetical protein
MSKLRFSKAESVRPDQRMKRVYLILIDFVLPLPMTALIYGLWYRRTGSWLFPAYTLALGVLFGYIFPGIGTNVFHLWKFNGPFKMGNYFIHHGFMYAPYLALVFYVAFPAGAPLTVGNIVRILISAGFIQCVLSCHHDTWGVATGMIEIASPPSTGNLSPVETVTRFALVGFWLAGATYSASCLLAYRAIVVNAQSNGMTFVILLVIGLALMSIAALQYAFGLRALLLGFTRLGFIRKVKP